MDTSEVPTSRSWTLRQYRPTVQAALGGGLPRITYHDEARQSGLRPHCVAESTEPGARPQGFRHGLGTKDGDMVRAAREEFSRFSYCCSTNWCDANVELYGACDRASISVTRVPEDTGFRARYGLAEASAHSTDWTQRYRIQSGYAGESACTIHACWRNRLHRQRRK